MHLMVMELIFSSAHHESSCAMCTFSRMDLIKMNCINLIGVHYLALAATVYSAHIRTISKFERRKNQFIKGKTELQSTLLFGWRSKLSSITIYGFKLHRTTHEWPHIIRFCVCMCVCMREGIAIISTTIRPNQSLECTIYELNGSRRKRGESNDIVICCGSEKSCLYCLSVAFIGK